MGNLFYFIFFLGTKLLHLGLCSRGRWAGGEAQGGCSVPPRPAGPCLAATSPDLPFACQERAPAPQHPLSN